MSCEPDEPYIATVDIGAWVERARADPAAYVERQATEIFLTAVGMAESLADKLFLKGGILMGVVYRSPRQTGDIDFTTTMDPDQNIAEEIGDALNRTLPRAAAELGYPDLRCQVQSWRYYPSGELFAKADGPAVKLKIGYARRNSAQEKHLNRGRATDVLEVDISFREPVVGIQVVHLGDGGGQVRAYSLYDLIAEKLRALLQQESRNRYRRQDIYDLDALVSRFSLDDDEKRRVHETFAAKCEARKLTPTIDALSSPEVIRRAKEEWSTLSLEIGEVPDFDGCFGRVDAFYRSLPWQTSDEEKTTLPI